jgi:hypothetical protein
MRLIKQDIDFLPFPCGFDLALAHTILQTIRALASTLLNSQQVFGAVAGEIGSKIGFCLIDFVFLLVR